MNSGQQSRVLYLFTKEYPFGKMEKYIDHELPVLAKRFDRVVLVPTEFFSGTSAAQTTSVLPVNAEVLDINAEVKESGRGAAGVLAWAIRIWLYEFFVYSSRRYLLKYFRKNFNILVYQLIVAKCFRDVLQKERPAQRFFYTYWFHHSTLMLSAMKQKGWINGFISRAHSIDLYNEDWAFVDDDHKPLPYYCFKLKHISRLCSISEHGKKFLLKKYPQYAGKFRHFYLGVPDNGVGPYHENDVFTVVTCSVFNDNKRIYLVPEILSALDFPVRWVHFGAGGDNPERVMNAVKQLPDRVKAELRGSVPNREIIGFYKQNTVHLLLNLSIAEGVPVSIMEAMSFGIPVIATRVYGSPELLADGNGVLIDVSDSPVKIAQHIDRMRTDQAATLAMRSDSRRAFEQKLEVVKNINEFVDQLLR